MRNAALILGVIGGIVGMMVGFFAYGFAALSLIWEAFFRAAEELGAERVVQEPLISKLVALCAPIAAIAGGAMAPSRPAVASLLLVLSALGTYWGFDFNVFTMFPIAMCAVAGLLALGGALTAPIQPPH